MPTLTFTLAALLVILGLVGYIPTNAATALIPTYVGFVFGVLGFVALRNCYRKHAMHAAVALATLVVVSMGAMAGPKLPALLHGDATIRTHAVIAQLVMGLLCAVYLGFGVKSFINARRKPAE